LLKQGQSLAHIYAFHGHEIPCSRRTLYNYIDKGVFTAKNIDLRRRVRYKCKPRKTGTRISLAAREFRIGRTYEDFGKYMKEHPENGTEFQFPTRLECDKNGEIRTKIFYCNPNCSWQKGMLEKNHEYIRYVIPKGASLEPYTQAHAIKLMNHINSEARDSLNGCTPFRLSLLLLSNKLHKLLKLREIPADEVALRPSLLKK